MSLPLTDQREALDSWCQSYVTAFSSYDSQAIGVHWAFPALIVSGKHNLTFDTVDRFNRNTDGLLGFYRKMGVVKAHRKLLTTFPMGQGTASITVRDKMIDANGNTIVSWEAAYVLRQYGGKWLAIMANADGEAAAWKANGTPLGR